MTPPEAAVAMLTLAPSWQPPPLPLDRIRTFVERAVARICVEETSGERLQGAVEAAMAQAAGTCSRWGCGACDRLWSEPGLSCEARRIRSFVKRLTMALLPMLRRGCALDAVRTILEEAVNLALGHTEAPGPRLSGPDHAHHR